MRRFFFFLLFVVSLPAAGCGDETEPAPEAPASEAPAAQAPPEREAEDRLIDPAGAVGGITPATREADLVARFGAGQVESVQVDVGEGMSVSGTRLFAGTPDVLTIEWKEDGTGPQRITIAGAGTRWHTAGGLTIGTPLADVERLNGEPFLLTGFEWDYPGRTVSWEDGVFPAALQLAFRPTAEAALQGADGVLGDVQLRSDQPVVRALGLVVDRIFVRW